MSPTKAEKLFTCEYRLVFFIILRTYTHTCVYVCRQFRFSTTPRRRERSDAFTFPYPLFEHNDKNANLGHNGTRARSIVERGGMAKEMSSNLFRMFQFGVEDRRTCPREYKAECKKDYRIIHRSHITQDIAAISQHIAAILQLQ